MRGPVGNVTWQLASRGAYRVRREIARVRALLPRRLLSNPEATGSKGLHASKELRSPDVPIASRPTVVLRRRSGSVGMPRRGRQPRIDEAVVCRELTQILGHNSEESLATATSTGVTSGATQLFAGAPSASHWPAHSSQRGIDNDVPGDSARPNSSVSS